MVKFLSKKEQVTPKNPCRFLAVHISVVKHTEIELSCKNFLINGKVWLYDLWIICLISLTSGTINAGSSSFINLRKDSDRTIFSGCTSKIIQLTKKLRSSVWRDSLWGVTSICWWGA